MGLMAESIVAYAQPLLDKTDGSQEQMQEALSIAQACWNLGLLSGTEQEKALAEMRPTLKMDDAEFAEFYQSVIMPMIERHHDMFPNIPRLDSEPAPQPFSHQKKFPGTGRNAPCPCNSGKKYKRCCGK